MENNIAIPKPKLRMAALIFTAGPVALILSVLFSITQGAAMLPLSTAWKAIIAFDPADTAHLIIIDIRLSRAIAAVLVGSAFAVSGAVMQGMTRNPLADSGLLGLNAGAGFALSVCLALFPKLRYITIILASFLGAALGTALVNGIASARRGGATPMRIVLAGCAVSALLGALSQGVALYFDVEKDVMFWTAGGLSGTNWQHIKILAPFIVGALLFAIILSRSISLLSLGEDMAKGLGLNTALVNFLGSVVVMVLAGASVSVIGSVGFVGLIIPHLTRRLTGMDYRLIIPASAILGGILVVWADVFARIINPPTETPIGALIALVGIPFFLYLSRRERRTL
jgi:iron complex transport system permease protein